MRPPGRPAVRIGAAAALAVAALLPARPAAAFTLIAANNSALRGWAKDELVFRLNADDCGIDAGTMESAVRDALDLWNSVPDADLRLKYGGRTATTAAEADSGAAADSPVIVCDAAFNTTTGTTGDGGTLGIGGPRWTNDVIDYGYLLLNADVGNSPTRNITTISTTRLSIVVAHEIGHVLGIGHSEHPSALMHYSVGQKSRLALAQDDADAMAYLYPRSEPFDGFLGCGALAVGPPPGGPGTGVGAALFAFWFVFLPALATRLTKSFASSPVRG